MNKYSNKIVRKIYYYSTLLNVFLEIINVIISEFFHNIANYVTIPINSLNLHISKPKNILLSRVEENLILEIKI